MFLLSFSFLFLIVWYVCVCLFSFLLFVCVCVVVVVLLLVCIISFDNIFAGDPCSKKCLGCFLPISSVCLNIETKGNVFWK